MKLSIKKGLSFGLTSGIITTLGLIVGLHSETGLRLAVIGGILTIAIADSCSDALGIHVSEEASGLRTDREVWESTIFTFIAKFFFALTFLVPVLIFQLETAIIISVIYGLLVLGITSYFMAKQQGSKPWKVILEHMGTALFVIIVIHFAGEQIGKFFG